MSAPALALRPPCGRTGSPSRPRHRCISAGGGRGNCAGRRFSVKMTGKAGPGGGYSGKPAGELCRAEGIGGKFGGRGNIYSFLLIRAFRRSRKARCFFEGERGAVLPGDGCGKESVGAVAASHLSEESALGKGWGVWGEGKPLSRWQRPDGGRRPCPLRRRKLRASTAEMRGFPSPQLLKAPQALERGVVKKSAFLPLCKFAYI